jgi:hypothetical protein
MKMSFILVLVASSAPFVFAMDEGPREKKKVTFCDPCSYECEDQDEFTDEFSQSSESDGSTDELHPETKMMPFQREPNKGDLVTDDFDLPTLDQKLALLNFKLRKEKFHRHSTRYVIYSTREGAEWYRTAESYLEVKLQEHACALESLKREYAKVHPSNTEKLKKRESQIEHLELLMMSEVAELIDIVSALEDIANTSAICEKKELASTTLIKDYKKMLQELDANESSSLQLAEGSRRNCNDKTRTFFPQDYSPETWKQIRCIVQ